MTWYPADVLTRVKAKPCGALSPKNTASFPLLSHIPAFFFATRDPLPAVRVSLINFEHFFQISARASHSVRSLSMEENLFPHIHAPLSDPQPLDGCGTELTLTNSDSSAITVDSSKEFSHQGAAPLPDQVTKWTDQKHSLYLHSLEASFVNELHHSMRLRGWCLQNNSKEANKSKTFQDSLNMSRQFLVLQDGCWKEISLERNEPLLESTADSHVVAGSPLRLTSVERGCNVKESDAHDRDLLCGEDNHTRESSSFFTRLPRRLEKQCVFYSSNPETIDSTAEVTDQNFREEDQEARSSCPPMMKRLKTSTADTSSNDQVVPFGKFQARDISTSTNSSSQYKGQHELLSELPESFHFPKSDLHYFLRGS